MDLAGYLDAKLWEYIPANLQVSMQLLDFLQFLIFPGRGGGKRRDVKALENQTYQVL